jgi:hypothetical protein
VRECAAQKEIDAQAALGVGIKEKAEEFVASGGEIYQQTIAMISMRDFSLFLKPVSSRLSTPLDDSIAI